MLDVYFASKEIEKFWWRFKTYSAQSSAMGKTKTYIESFDPVV